MDFMVPVSAMHVKGDTKQKCKLVWIVQVCPLAWFMTLPIASAQSRFFVDFKYRPCNKPDQKLTKKTALSSSFFP